MSRGVANVTLLGDETKVRARVAITAVQAQAIKETQPVETAAAGTRV